MIGHNNIVLQLKMYLFNKEDLRFVVEFFVLNLIFRIFGVKIILFEDNSNVPEFISINEIEFISSEVTV